MKCLKNRVRNKVLRERSDIVFRWFGCVERMRNECLTKQILFKKKRLLEYHVGKN